MLTSQELRILARGKLKGKMKTKEPKAGHPVKKVIKTNAMGPTLRSNPAYS